MRRAVGKDGTSSRASSRRPSGASSASGPPPAIPGVLVESGRRGRLTCRTEFDAVYRNGHRRSSRQFTAFFNANGRGESRFGMSVGRALGSAVVRNRIRRRIREILRLDRGEIPSGWDIILHPRASVARAEFATLREELLSLLRNSIAAPSVSPRGEHNPSNRAPKPGSAL